MIDAQGAAREYLRMRAALDLVRALGIEGWRVVSREEWARARVTGQVLVEHDVAYGARYLLPPEPQNRQAALLPERTPESDGDR